ncbi:MAG: hypothetical protein IJ313_00265 [Clostridia bacterium]|nr:hypothetical protein [Clostridia bacterium]
MDISLYRRLNADVLRMSHAPCAEERYDLCDREGILVIDKMSVVGICAGNKIEPYNPFPLYDYHERVLRDMIARDRNHPSVIVWSLGNEPDTEYFPQSAYVYWKSLYDLAHQFEWVEPSGHAHLLPERLHKRPDYLHDGHGMHQPLLRLVLHLRRSGNGEICLQYRARLLAGN